MKDDKSNPRVLFQRGAKHPATKHQPRKAEREEEFDMPGASLGTVRRAFFRAFRSRQNKPK